MKKRSKLDLSGGPAPEKAQAVGFDELRLEESPEDATPEDPGGENDTGKAAGASRVSGRKTVSVSRRRRTGRQIAGAAVLVAVAAIAIYALTRRLLR